VALGKKSFIKVFLKCVSAVKRSLRGREKGKKKKRRFFCGEKKACHLRVCFAGQAGGENSDGRVSVGKKGLALN